MTPSADPDRAACANLPDIFESTNLFDHRIAVRYCLGEGDQPACPILAACKARTPGREAWHDGTWAGVLFSNGLVKAREGRTVKRGRPRKDAA